MRVRRPEPSRRPFAAPMDPTAARRRAAALALALCVALALALAAAALDVPYLAGRVNDAAGMLPADAGSRIEARLAEIEQKTGAQVAVLTVPGLEGDSLEDFSIRVAEAWKLGQKGKDNGVLLLIARDDRKMRIEVGYGLEPVLTDALSSRIINDVMRPKFRQGDFGGGVEAAVDTIGKVLEGDPEALPAESPAGSGAGMPLGAKLGVLGLFALVVGTFSFGALSTAGCASWGLYLFLLPFYAIFPTVILGPRVGAGVAGAWLLLFPLAKLLLAKTAAGQAFLKRQQSRSGGFSGWSSSGGGWRGGWGSGGGGWSSGGGGGGFSGGGGSFGGGGSSGGW